MAEAGILSSIPHTVVIESGLPDFSIKSQFLFRSGGEPSFNKLNGFFNGVWVKRRNQHMKMVRHDNKFMQLIFACFW